MHVVRAANGLSACQIRVPAVPLLRLAGRAFESLSVTLCIRFLSPVTTAAESDHEALPPQFADQILSGPTRSTSAFTQAEGFTCAVCGSSSGGGRDDRGADESVHHRLGACGPHRRHLCCSCRLEG